MTKKDEERFNDVYAIDVVKAVLESGNSVELTASGYSMFPTLRPGDTVIVKPPDRDKLPLSGIVLVVKNENSLIMHRLIEIQTDESGQKWIITRGDCMPTPDNPFRTESMIGIAASFNRKKKERIILRRSLSKHQYKINRLLIWLWQNLHRKIF